MLVSSILGFLGGIVQPKPIQLIEDKPKTFFQEFGGIAILGIIIIIALVAISKGK